MRLQTDSDGKPEEETTSEEKMKEEESTWQQR